MDDKIKNELYAFFWDEIYGIDSREEPNIYHIIDSLDKKFKIEPLPVPGLMIPYDPEITDLMTVGEFMEAVRNGEFINCDGTGYYGTADAYDQNCRAILSKIYDGTDDSHGYPYVHWFNK